MTALFDRMAAAELPLLWLAFAQEVLFKGLCLLVVAGLFGLLLRRASAAIRHLVWAATLAGLVALPVLSGFLPGWNVSGLPDVFGAEPAAVPDRAFVVPDADATFPAAMPSPDLAAGEPAAEPYATETPEPAGVLPPVETPAASSWSWETWAFAVWLAGALAVLARFGVGTLRLWWITRQARPVTEETWIVPARRLAGRLGLGTLPPMRMSGQAAMPFTWGIWRPVVLLSREAGAWPEERRQIVLLHEFAHIRRRDCLTQMLAQAACALYWFNPLVWLVARQHRMERERACDDQVIQCGARASSYADALLDMARSLRRSPSGSFAVVSIARRSQLEGRLLAILDPHADRRGATRWSALMAALLGFAVVIPFAAAQPEGEEEGETAASKAVLAISPVTPSSSEAPAAVSGFAPARRPAQPSPRIIPESTPDGDEQRAFATELAVLTHSPARTLNQTLDVTLSTTLSRTLSTTLSKTLSTTLNKTLNTTLSKTLDALETTGVLAGETPAAVALKAEAIDVLLKTSGVSAEEGRDFIAEVEAAGYRNLSVDDLVRLKRYDVTPAFIRQMKALGYDRLSVDDLVSLRKHGVTPAYIGQMKSALKRLPTVEELVKLRKHGVTLESIRKNRGTFGKDLSIDTIRRLQLHEVTPDLMAELESLGFARLSTDQLVSARIHNLTPEFIQSIRALGYADLPIDQYVNLRIHGVTPEYIREMRQLFGEDLTLDQIVKIRIASVTPEYVSKLAAMGFENLPVEKLVSAKLQGVTPEYIRSLREQGYADLSIDECIQARCMDITPEYIRSLREQGYADLSMDEYIQARCMGITPEFIAAARERGLRDLSIKQLVALKMSGILRE
jgi:beta-lactamase regulating signal transducer with metallopeptidase domain